MAVNSRPELYLNWATHAAAKYAVENWHYTGKMPVNKLVKVGVWENGEYIGVVIFGMGASAVIHRQFNVKPTQVCELVRVALREHKTTVLKMLSVALRFLKMNSPNLRVVVSFADPAEGHHGGIYQATNWIYTGDSQPTIEYYFNGDWRHVTDIYKRVRRENIKGLKTRKKQGKHRYVMPLDKEMAVQIAPLAKPYPKREKQAMAPPRVQRRGSTDPHAPNHTGDGEGISHSEGISEHGA